MKFFNQIIAAYAFCTIVPTALHAQDIVLLTKDGGTAVSGELLSYDGEVYVVRTLLGDLNVRALSVDCTGEKCPQTADASENVDLTILGEDKLVSLYLSPFADALGRALSAEVSQSSDLATLELVSDDKLRATIGSSDLSTLTELEAPENGLTITREAFQVNGLEVQSGDDTRSSLALSQSVIGLDATVVSTSPRNPIRAISTETLALIFSGKITDWGEIGSAPAPIRLYAETRDGSGTRLFENRVLAPFGEKLSDNVIVIGDTNTFDDVIAADPLAIGIGYYSSLSESIAVNIQDTCGISIPPNSFSIKTEEYPLSQRIYGYSFAQDTTNLIDTIVQETVRESFQESLEDVGIVGLNVSLQTPDMQGLRFQSAILADGVENTLADLVNLSETVNLADRLSITYRFQSGSATLDERARADIDRLSGIVSLGDLDNKEILLIGFTDAVGDAANNAILATQRAASVEKLLLDALPQGAADNVQIRSIGLGEVAPVNCNDTVQGQERNRRVEVWVRDIVRSVEQ